MKYALRVQFENSWLYVNTDEFCPILFDTLDEAEKMAQIWRVEGYEDAVEIVEYND